MAAARAPASQTPMGVGRSPTEASSTDMRARLQTHATTDRTRPVLVWRSPKPFLVCSSASFGGGMALRSWIANLEVPKDYDRTDLGAHADELKAELQLAG